MRLHVRRVPVIICFALCVGMLLGPTPILAAEKTTVTYWQHTSPARDLMIQEMAQEFMAANPDIQVELGFFPLGEFLNKVLVALAGGTGPDVIQVRDYWVQGLIRSNVLQPLSQKLITPDQMENEFIPRLPHPCSKNLLVFTELK